MKYTKSSAWSKAGDPADRRVLLSVALPPWPPRRGWSQGRTPMATTAVRCCCHDAREWLVSWIGTVLSDSAGGGTLPHLGEETLAGCEMLVNKVIARVTVRPCQPPPPLVRHRGIHSRASCYLWKISCLNLSFVWSLTWALSASAWSGSADNNVLVWKKRGKSQNSKDTF